MFMRFFIIILFISLNAFAQIPPDPPKHCIKVLDLIGSPSLRIPPSTVPEVITTEWLMDHAILGAEPTFTDKWLDNLDLSKWVQSAELQTKLIERGTALGFRLDSNKINSLPIDLHQTPQKQKKKIVEIITSLFPEDVSIEAATRIATFIVYVLAPDFLTLKLLPNNTELDFEGRKILFHNDNSPLLFSMIKNGKPLFAQVEPGSIEVQKLPMRLAEIEKKLGKNL